jgi:hypothetical protein
MINLTNEWPSLVLKKIVESLTNQFSGLKIKKSAAHIFITEKCNISLKRGHFHFVERDSPEPIQLGEALAGH